MRSNSEADSTAITVQELHAKFVAGEPVYLLDVRTWPEFENERLGFSDALIPYDSIPEYLTSLPEDKTTPIYTFCRSGRRSDIAAYFLRSSGYRYVYNVSGGIIAWKEAGYPTVSGRPE